MNLKVDLKIFLFLLLFLFTSQVEMYVLLMILAIIHELGHLIAGVLLGCKVQEISITPMGLQVKFKIKYEEYNNKILKGNVLGIKRGIIAIAGPLTNFILVAIELMLINIIPELTMISICGINYQTIIYANFIIGTFNLIPIYPLDGGRIIKEILHITVGLRKSYEYVHIISKITIILLTAISSIAILYLQNIAILFMIVYLWLLVTKKI